MKKYFTFKYTRYEIIIFLFFIFGYLFMSSFKTQGLEELKKSTIYYENAYTNNFDYYLNQNLPYNEYKHLQDSVNKIKIDFLNKQQCSGSKFSTGWFGIGSLQNEKEEKIEQKYFILNDFYIKPNRNFFVIEKGSVLKKYTKIIHETDGNEFSHINYSNYDSTKVNYKYDYDDKCILIPLSSFGLIFSYLLLIISGFILLFLTVNLYSGILAVLSNIANGAPFIIHNYNILNRISIALILFPIAIFLIKGCIYLTFYNSITINFLWNWKYNLFNNFEYLYFGVLAKIVANAFKKGNAIQQENDFTI